MTKEEILDKALDGKCCNREAGYIDDYDVYDPIEEAMEEWAKEDFRNFIEWMSEKTSVFVDYLQNVKPLVTSQEIEEKLKEFEGVDLMGRYELYQKQKAE